MAECKQEKDKWIPWYFIMFFVILALLDGIFVYLATSTHTGLVTEQAYQKGLNYNDTVSAAEAQEQSGWQGSIAYEAGYITFMLADTDGMPVGNAQVEAYFSRPTQAGHDFFTVLPVAEKGRYSTQVDFPLKGQWDIRIVAKWKQQSYQKHRRIIVK